MLLGNEVLVPPMVRCNQLLTLSFVVVALQKLMGNVLLHLEEGERLDINCTKLLNDEVRSTQNKLTAETAWMTQRSIY